MHQCTISTPVTFRTSSASYTIGEVLCSCRFHNPIPASKALTTYVHLYFTPFPRQSIPNVIPNFSFSCLSSVFHVVNPIPLSRRQSFLTHPLSHRQSIPHTSVFHVVNSFPKHLLFTSPIHLPSIYISLRQLIPQISAFHVVNPPPKYPHSTSSIHPPNICVSRRQSMPKHPHFMSSIHSPNICFLRRQFAPETSLIRVVNLFPKHLSCTLSKH